MAKGSAMYQGYRVSQVAAPVCHRLHPGTLEDEVIKMVGLPMLQEKGLV